MMKKVYFAPALFLLIFTSHAWGQTNYSGELIYFQGDFRELDIFGAGPVTGSVSGNTLTITSQGGKYTYQGYQDPKYTLDWSINLDKNVASSMTTGTGVTTYQGNFVYGQTNGSQSLTGTGQLNGAASNGNLILQTYNGRLGVNGVNPANTTVDDWNTAAFNWNMSIPLNTVRSWLGL